MKAASVSSEQGGCSLHPEGRQEDLSGHGLAGLPCHRSPPSPPLLRRPPVASSLLGQKQGAQATILKFPRETSGGPARQRMGVMGPAAEEGQPGSGMGVMGPAAGPGTGDQALPPARGPVGMVCPGCQAPGLQPSLLG